MSLIQPDVNEVVNNLANTVAELTKENAILKAMVSQLQQPKESE